MEWISPQHELCINGDILLEPGQVFRTSRNVRHDNLIREIGQLIPLANLRNRQLRSCLDCGKVFGNRFYWLLHRIQGCNRGFDQQVFYDMLREEAKTNNEHEYILWLLRQAAQDIRR